METVESLLEKCFSPILFIDGILHPFDAGCSLYYINREGVVYSVKAKRYLKAGKHGLGYLQYYLTNFIGGGRWYKAHRLVALQYIPNPFDLSDVNHINGIKDDNRVENLDWASHSDNILHSYRVLGRVHDASHTQKKCLCVTTGVEYSSMKAAADANGCFLSNVSACCSGKIKSTNGLVFSKIIHD